MNPTQYVDYVQTAEDHQSLLVLILHVGSHLPSQQFQRGFERISRVDCIHVQGQKRNISVRYKKNYSVEFNSWGDFQTHRRVLGLIALGKCTDHVEFDTLFGNYKKVKEEYASTIINSRLVVYGMNTDGSPLEKDNGDVQENSGIAQDNDKTGVGSDAKSDNSSNNAPEIKTTKTPKTLSTSKANGVGPGLGSSERRSHSNSLTKESSGAEVVFYPGVDQSPDLEDRIKEFVTSLYYVLEGKRLDRSFERNDKLTLLCAPFERKDYVGVDTDTK